MKHLPQLFHSSVCLEAQARTDHGADDEGDAAEEVDAALQLVVLVHVGRHVAALSLPQVSIFIRLLRMYKPTATALLLQRNWRRAFFYFCR